VVIVLLLLAAAIAGALRGPREAGGAGACSQVAIPSE
jgi:hypothetical protein